MFIVGWGKQTIKDYGAIGVVNCPNCHNDEVWRMVRRATWFTFFFIPIFPYKWEKFIVCPVCSYRLEVSGDNAEKFEKLANAGKLLANGNISKEEYLQKREKISEEHSDGSDTTENKQVYEASIQNSEKDGVKEQREDKTVFCSNCGEEHTRADNYCQKCGNELANLS